MRALVDFCVGGAFGAVLLDEAIVVEAESVRLRAAGSICMVCEGSPKRDGLREAGGGENYAFMKRESYQIQETGGENDRSKACQTEWSTRQMERQ